MFELKEKTAKFFRYLRELDRVAALSAATAVIPIFISTMLLIFAPVVETGNWMRENCQTATIGYVLFVWLVCGFALLPTNVIGILCGWAFGFPLGIALHMIGIVGAALVSSYVLAPLTGNNLQNFLETHEKAGVLYKALLKKNFRRTTLILTLLRLSPAMPFAMTNLLMAAARVPLLSFLIGTFAGMLPRSSFVVFIGAGLSILEVKEPFNAWMFGFGFVATLLSVLVISSFSRRALARLTAEHEGS